MKNLSPEAIASLSIVGILGFIGFAAVAPKGALAVTLISIAVVLFGAVWMLIRDGIELSREIEDLEDTWPEPMFTGRTGEPMTEFEKNRRSERILKRAIVPERPCGSIEGGRTWV